MKSILAFCFLLTIPSTAFGQGTVPIGEEFQVNTYTTGSQFNAALAVAGNGEFVVAWQGFEYQFDNYRSTVQVRRFESDGIPASDEILVAETLGDARGRMLSRPDVALTSGGEFVVVWIVTDYSTDHSSVNGRLFFADGRPQGDSFQINTFPSDVIGVNTLKVASAADGNFLVVWQGDGFGNDPTQWAIQGRRYASNGRALGDQFQINTYTTGIQRAPAVAASLNGDFVAVWPSYGSGGNDASFSSIQMRRFDSLGTAIGDDFQVNSYTTSGQYQADVAFGSGGDFWVTWSSRGSGGTDNNFDLSIQARRFGSDGLPVAAEFQVNTFTTGFQASPQVAAGSDGSFLVIWESPGSAGTDTSELSIQGRRFRSTGLPAGEDFQINTYTTGGQERAVLGADDIGRFVVTWDSLGSNSSDTDALSIQAQRYILDRIFANGFESGDTSAWN